MAPGSWPGLRDLQGFTKTCEKRISWPCQSPKPLKRTDIVWPSPRCLEISLPAGYLSSAGQVLAFLHLQEVDDVRLNIPIFIALCHSPGTKRTVIHPKAARRWTFTGLSPAFWSHVCSGTKHLFSATLSRRLCVVCGWSTARLA